MGILLWFVLKTVLPMFPSKTFIVSGLTFRSLVHFEFIFVYIRKCSNFILFTLSCPVFLAPLIEETVSSLYILASSVKDMAPIGLWAYLWAFYLVRLVYISVFVPVSYTVSFYFLMMQKWYTFCSQHTSNFELSNFLRLGICSMILWWF